MQFHRFGAADCRSGTHGRPRRPALALAGVFLIGSLGSAHALDAFITADNAYSFGFGPASGPTSLVASVENCSSAQIFSCATPGPESYSNVPGAAGNYMYIVAYSDESVTQGLIGRFVNGSVTLLTGDPGWSVFATGIDHDPCGGQAPSLAIIQAQIALANSGQGGAGSSGGWVGTEGGAFGTQGRLVVGEANDTGPGCFGQACASILGTTPRWIWYTPDFATIPSPSCSFAVPGEFLIFRTFICAVNGSACDDGKSCTQNDACQLGVCTGTATANGMACQEGDSDPCTAGACQAGACVSGPASNGTPCADANPCTSESCQSGSCVGTGPAPNGTSCNDGNDCTTPDACQAGNCTGGPAVANGSPCSDGNSCSTESCQSGNCTYSGSAPNGTVCSDGDGCTANESCLSGACLGATYICGGTQVPVLPPWGIGILIVLLGVLGVWRVSKLQA